MGMYAQYAEKEREFLALTGYTREEFDALLPSFSEAYYEWMSQYCLNGKPRRNRKHSDYQNCPLPTMAEKQFFILHYLKSNNLQSVQGALFGISQPKANLWIHCLHPILNQALARLGELPAREMSAVEFDQEQAAVYFHDGTERPIQRPKDPEKQRDYYSGKKNSIRSRTSP